MPAMRATSTSHSSNCELFPGFKLQAIEIRHRVDVAATLRFP